MDLDAQFQPDTPGDAQVLAETHVHLGQAGRAGPLLSL